MRKGEDSLTLEVEVKVSVEIHASTASEGVQYLPCFWKPQSNWNEIQKLRKGEWASKQSIIIYGNSVRKKSNLLLPQWSFRQIISDRFLRHRRIWNKVGILISDEIIKGTMNESYVRISGRSSEFVSIGIHTRKNDECNRFEHLSHLGILPTRCQLNEDFWLPYHILRFLD